jgi:hypothetical protein
MNATARDFAEAYRQLGWPVLPVEPGGKRPLFGQGLNHASTDPDTIDEWFRREPNVNIAVRLDAIGLAAVDIDPRNGGSLDLAAELPATLSATTASGGAHLLYRVGRDVKLPGRLAQGVDLKHRGYINVEPSRTSAGSYHWRGWDPLKDGEPHIASAPNFDRSASPRELDPAHRIQSGSRNDYLSREAYRLRKQGRSPEQIEPTLQALNRHVCDPPLPEVEVRAIALGKGSIPTEDMERRALQRERNRHIGADIDQSPLADMWSLDDALRQLVLVERKSQVAVLPPDGVSARRVKLLSLGDFRASAAASRRAINEWQRNIGRLTVESVTFAPGRSPFTDDPHGARSVNVWRPHARGVPPEDWEQRVEIFLTHTRFLVPDSEEHALFLDWLAHIEQRPGELPHFGYLMTTPAFGTGRNWLASVLTRVWRGYVAASIDLAKLLARDFGGQISGRLLAIVDEIHLTDNGRALRAQEAALRQLMTADERYVNHKHGPETVEFNCLRWLLFSNHADALPMPAGDRRFVVIANPTAPRDPDYYTRLYAALGDPLFIDSVAHFLATRDLRTFNPGALPLLNDAKRAVISASRPALERELEVVIAAWTCPLATSTELMEAVDLHPDDFSGRKRFADAMRRLGHKTYVGAGSRGRFTFNGQRCTVWMLRDRERYAAASPEEIERTLKF